MATLCYFCDDEAVSWMDWTVHNGGKLASLVAVVGVCQDHGEFIVEASAGIAEIPTTVS